jgi:fructan beta-fructosidase
VLSAADGRYMLGDFDGREFHPDAGKHQLWHGHFYAAQTFSDTPDGRRIQIGWGKGIAFPGMPFNQQMTFPCVLTLRTTEDGVRMCAEPVAEIASLRGRAHSWADRTIRPGENLLAGLAGDLFEIHAELAVAGADACGFTVRGVPVTYDVARHEVSCRGTTAPLRPRDDAVRLRLLVDRGSIEVFGDDGRVALSVGVIPHDEDHSLELFTRGGDTRVRSLEVFELESAWPRP